MRLGLLFAFTLALAGCPSGGPSPLATDGGERPSPHRLGALTSLQSQLTIGLQLQGSGIASSWSSGTIANNPSPGQQLPVTLANGNNAIAVPTNARAIIVVPTPTSTVAKLFKTVSGDTGTQMSNTDPLVFPFVPGSVPATVYINAAASDSVFVFFT
jgi:hypothetical protein